MTLQKEEVTVQKLLELIVNLVDEQKSKNITTYQLNDPTLFDYVIIVTAQNKVHGKGLLDSIVKLSKDYPLAKSDEFYEFPHVSGHIDSEWITIDFNTIVVHVMGEALREHYGLDDILQHKAVTWHK